MNRSYILLVYGMKLVRLIKNVLGGIIRITYRMLYRFFPIDNKTVMFISFHGRGYSDNPKAIFEEIKKDERFSDYTFLWAIKDHKNKKIEIEGAKIIEYFSIPYFYHLSKAKYWVFNCKMPTYLCKKPKQVYLQTWHGTPLKRLGRDIQVSEDTTFYRSQLTIEQMYQSYDIDVARYNYMISPNGFCTTIFQSAFGINKERLIETGYPRNDILSNVPKEECIALKKKMSIPLDKKVVLYAPTWRDNQYVTQGYTFKLEADFRKWKEALGDDYILVFKPHYLIINDYGNDPELEGFLYSIDASEDISTLYLIADVLVTDYSSVFFDYAIVGKPIYFYMYDLDSYKEELRGFYIDLYKDLPGKIYEDETIMLEDISKATFDYEKLAQFNKRFNEHEDGLASKRVVDIMFHEI